MLWLTGCLTTLLAGWLFSWLFSWLAGLLLACLPACLPGCLAASSAYCKTCGCEIESRQQKQHQQQQHDSRVVKKFRQQQNIKTLTLKCADFGSITVNCISAASIDFLLKFDRTLETGTITVCATILASPMIKIVSITTCDGPVCQKKIQ
uniref:C2H2-type domain-containing protein n=1 Tax=Glossina austeni TaxID=7395 RepID=A0A1A9UFV6_GLOAU